jgi:hypothetical protein
MISLIIGIAAGLLAVAMAELQRRLDKPTVFGLLLSGIAFLYVGFTWANMQALVISSVQALFFLGLSYYGINRSLWFLIVGYFVHGIWDVTYHLFADSLLIPPHYNLFCLAVDLTISLYLLVVLITAKAKKAEVTPFNRYTIPIRKLLAKLVV